MGKAGRFFARKSRLSSPVRTSVTLKWVPALCGVPVLASDVPRLRMLVENQHSGLLARPGDVAAWSETIRLAAGSPIARRRWARNARLVAEERLGWQAVARQFEELFTAAKARDEVSRAATRAVTPAAGGEAESRLG